MRETDTDGFCKKCRCRIRVVDGVPIGEYMMPPRGEPEPNGGRICEDCVQYTADFFDTSKDYVLDVGLLIDAERIAKPEDWN